MKKMTPVVLVEEIESVLPFWMDRLGFAKTTEVPHEDRLGFVILAKDGVEIMYQSRPSMRADIAELADSTPLGGNLLFIQVDNLDEVVSALEGIEPVIPRRKTFYGADEYTVREPGGNVVTFAQFGT